MTVNEPVLNRPESGRRSDVTPLLDVLPGIDEPDAGRHALARPVPIPPDADRGTGPADEAAPAEPFEAPVAGYLPAVSEPVPAPGSEPGTAPADLVDSESEPPNDPVEQTAAPVPTPTTTPVPAPRADLDLDPHPPTRAGWGSRVLGALLGLVVGPVGAVALLLGQSQVLAVQADDWDADVDVSGIALVIVSALVLAGLVLLAAWTAAAPITGGVVTTAFGGWALIAPGVFSDSVSISGSWQATAEQTVVAGTSGTLLAVGLLLLAAGIAAVAARRAGVRLGTFEGRTGAR